MSVLNDAGRMIVTDLQFWQHDPAWSGNLEELFRHGAVFAENVNLFCLDSFLVTPPHPARLWWWEVFIRTT